MSIKKSLSIISFSLITALIVFLIFVIFIDPDEMGVLGLIISLLAIFIAFSSFFSLIFIILNLRLSKEKEFIFEKFIPSFRRAVLLAIFLIGVILFKHLGILNWLNVVAFFVIIFLSEIMFSLKRKRMLYLEEE